MSHTPGPWESRPVPGANVIVIAQEGMMYPHAFVTTPTDGPEPLTEREYENARLIAAAPEMLQAIRESLEEMNDPARWTANGFFIHSAQFYLRLRDAYLKAMGDKL